MGFSNSYIFQSDPNYVPFSKFVPPPKPPTIFDIYRDYIIDS